MNYKQLLKQYNDFPQKGVVFQDINPLLADKEVLHSITDDLTIAVKKMLPNCNKILAIEARGFILGSILAERLHAGFVPIRKKGKLPPYSSVKEMSYNLEYGENALALDASLLHKDDKILIFDDVLATGGTVTAVVKLLQEEAKNGNLTPLTTQNICFAFLLELEQLNGKNLIFKNLNCSQTSIFSLIKI